MSESDKVKSALLSNPLTTDFYRKNTVEVARDLLGKVLLVQSNAGLTAGRIVETEAYRGDDPAAHSYRGETLRNSVMFGEPGVAYVYFIYGMYEMLNFVTEEKGYPGAVLIRAVQPLLGEELMRVRRKASQGRKLRFEDLTNGPGKLCLSMGIEMLHNGESLQGPVLFVSDDGFRPQEIWASGRVGIRLGTERPWRFFVQGDPFVSRVRQNREGRPA